MAPPLRVTGLFALALISLLACSPARSGPAPAVTAAGTAAAAASVTYKDFQVDPTTLEVKVGQSVTWTNRDGTTHTVTSGIPGSKSGVFEQKVAGGATATVTFDKAGTFEFFCEFHVTMHGRIVVR